MNVKIDSRKIEKGDTFVALRGIDHDGHAYIRQAIENGAAKIICEEGSYEVETCIVEDTRAYLVNYLKDTYYDKISKLKLIGITGTNGKTTSAFLLHQMLNKLGRKCGYIGTIGFYVGEKIRSLANTTPDIYDLYAILLQCLSLGCEYVVMEVSSQGLANHRVETLRLTMRSSQSDTGSSGFPQDDGTLCPCKAGIIPHVKAIRQSDHQL